MKVTFKINYKTNWGENLYISGNVPELGANKYSQAIPMTYSDDGNWTATVEFDECKEFSYRYYVLSGDKSYKTEWGHNRKFYLLQTADYILDDTWKVNGIDKTYYSSAFTEGLIVHTPSKKAVPVPKSAKVLCFKIAAPQVPDGYSVGVLGNCKELGDWSEENVKLMNDNHYPMWHVCINANKLPENIEYKYVIYDNNLKKVVAWEWGENRYMNTADVTDVYVRRDEVLRYGIGQFKCAGVAIPVFSLRTNESFGIGEFSDIKKMVDWANKSGQKIIQTLPINDTTRFRTNADSYPYSAITVMGLHPVYINPFEIGILEDENKMNEFYAARDEFNQSPTVMYQEVCAKKWEYFKLIYKQIGKQTLASKEYKEFAAANEEWLYPYACFCFFRDYYGTANFHEWEQYSRYNKEFFLMLVKSKKHADELKIHLFLQFMAHVQLSNATKYASEHGVVLKGDIPIGISPESVEAWTDPQLFNLDSQAGAPPDPFSETGQNWGFPTYNWQAMSRDGYSWWMKRFQKMETYFKIYRIDHVLGFFRIWRMNEGDVQGLLGQFDPALPMTEQEICSYGTWFEYHRMTHPFIREYMLMEMFGANAQFVKNTFLEMVTQGIYRFRSDFPNQKSVEKFFQKNAGKLDLSYDDEKWIYGGVMSLFTEVLFIEDCHEKGKFHPRIGMQNTYSFRELDWNVQQALNRLYDDFFYRRHNYFWGEQAMKKLPALLGSTDMLCCAEDLGMIPTCVPEVMKSLYMLSLEIERMPKDPHDEFVPLHSIPYLSVCTTSTHDMAPIRMWWKEDRGLTQRYFNGLGNWGEAPEKCEPWICEQILNRNLYSPAMLVILPLQDWLSISGEYRRPNEDEERINIPSDPHHFWCYRMHLSLEELISHDDLNNKISEMVRNSGR